MNGGREMTTIIEKLREIRNAVDDVSWTVNYDMSRVEKMIDEVIETIKRTRRREMDIGEWVRTTLDDMEAANEDMGDEVDLVAQDPVETAEFIVSELRDGQDLNADWDEVMAEVESEDALVALVAGEVEKWVERHG